MKRRSRITWSALLSFVMAFLMGVHPHTTNAATANGSTVTQEQGPVISSDELKVEQGTEINEESTVVEGPVTSVPSGEEQNKDKEKGKNKEKGKDREKPTVDILPPPTGNEQEVAVLALAPVAVWALTSATIGAIFTAATSWYIDRTMFQNTVSDKKDISQETYGVEYKPAYYPAFPELIYPGVTIDTSATKHMEQAMVQAVVDRIKLYGGKKKPDGDVNLRMYSSTANPGHIMTVIDIASGLGGTVNRHLGNWLSGRWGPLNNYSAYPNEWMDLSGYSVFIVTDKSKRKYYHAHFTPTRLRDREIEYNRYHGEYDVQIRPTVVRDTKYRNLDPLWGDRSRAAMVNRGLYQQPGDRYHSVIPRP